MNIIIIDEHAGERPAKAGEFKHWETGQPVPAGTPIYESVCLAEPMFEALMDDGDGPEWHEVVR